MEQKINPAQKSIYHAGFAFIGFSLLLFIVQQFIPNRGDETFGIFIVNGLLSFVYFLLIIGNRIRKAYRQNNEPSIAYGIWVNFVLLYTISAFSLNTVIPVFAPFPWWLTLYTLLSASFLLLFPYLQSLPKQAKLLLYFIAGSATVLIVYLNLYLLPLWPISIIGSFFFLISSHTFVPLLWGILIIAAISKDQDFNFRVYLAGLALPLAIAWFYLYQWNNTQSLIKEVKAQNQLSSQGALPEEYAIAQRLPMGKLASEIVISQFYVQRFWSGGMGLDFDGDKKYHNPLAIIAHVLFGELDIDVNTAHAILNINKDQRHKSEDRLWTGISLKTSTVTTQVKLMPQYRLAYTEKIITIKYDERADQSWFVQPTQQALYTFHLPEGTVVTSLSLWVNGKEEKSRLTTKQRADSAFKTIVGVERRDPALVHWREGNRVVVSVFPCTQEEDRKFKIGFTSPLKCREGKLILENIWFEGPEAKQATEAIEISCEGGLPEIDYPEFMDKAEGKLVYTGTYEPWWTLTLPKVPLATNYFEFNGYRYALQEAKQVPMHFEAEKIYVDLNRAWTIKELQALLAAANGKPVIALGSTQNQITAENAEELLDKYSEYNFTLPALYLIEQPGQALLVTKGLHTGPVLTEIENSDFGQRLNSWLQTHTAPLKVVNIGTDFSPFFKSLNELRIIDYQPLSVNSLENYVKTKQWLKPAENDTLVQLKESNVWVTKSKVQTKELSTAMRAPDHVMRFFAYNHVMARLGKNYFSRQKFEEQLLRESEEAYVLTPVTSLIVLETEADYERFNIDKNKNSLGNASFSGGAVPEPHEWLLISLLAVFALVYFLKVRP